MIIIFGGSKITTSQAPDCELAIVIREEGDNDYFGRVKICPNGAIVQAIHKFGKITD